MTRDDRPHLEGITGETLAGRDIEQASRETLAGLGPPASVPHSTATPPVTRRRRRVRIPRDMGRPLILLTIALVALTLMLVLRAYGVL